MSLADAQRAFAAHLRDPERHPPPPDVEPRRMAVYRELFLNNVSELLAGGFPVARGILGETGWKRLVRRFYAGHRARTPYFLELPGEFVEWLAAHPSPDEPPFLAELAHYEWVELALAVSEAEASAAGSPPAGDPLDLPLAVSPLAWPLAYRWPVHRLGPDHQPAEPPAAPTFLVVYRDAANRVQFLEISAETARLLEAVEREPGTRARDGLDSTAAASARPAVADLLARGVLTPAAG